MLLSHAPILETRNIPWPDEAACAAFAGALARRPGIDNAVVELQGPLGAGKTTFVRHLLRALGVGGRIKSPTFAVIEPYELPGLKISHFDFYRFDDPHEWQDAGFRDVFAEPGLKLVEWPEKAAGRLPVPDLRLHIEPQSDGSRMVMAQAFSALGAQWLA
jgi:tRNA threonylcarbamoyladenosine biosynthesis protein TsaE